MEQGQLNWVANFIWGIADDVLRDLSVRGKYRDVILPMLVLRRLDAVLKPTKQAVLAMKASLDKAKIANQDQTLRQTADHALSSAALHPGVSSTRRRRAVGHVATCAYTGGVESGIRELKDNLSRYIRRVEAGQRIAVTSHGRVVAELVLCE